MTRLAANSLADDLSADIIERALKSASIYKERRKREIVTERVGML
jgi:hypothetical protein